MTTLNNTIETFTYFWEIKNPRYCGLPTGEFIESPKFCVPQFWNTEWFMKLYPHGQNEINKKKTYFILYRGNDSGPDTIEIKYSISLSSKKEIHSSKDNFQKNMGYKHYPLLPQPLDSFKDSIVIVVEMQCNLHDLKNTEYSSLKNYITYPLKCFVESKVLYSTKYIQRYIDPLINGSCSKIAIPLILQDEYPTLILNLQTAPKDLVSLKIGLKDEGLKESLKVICKMRVANNVGQVLHSFEEKHTFTTVKDNIWSLTNNINKAHLKVHLSDFSLNKISLKADFGISHGKTLSEIVSVEHAKAFRTSIPDYDCEISKEMFRFYRERLLCDFTLKVGGEVFNVHKIVLCAASPVFDVMFSNEMVEKKNNTVDIVDVDKETVEQMLSFMYTGSIKDLHYDRAKRLFVAADKYQISILLDVVRNVLISQINNNTICEILVIADTYKDAKLEKEAMEYFKLNKTSVIKSSNWDTLENENADVAAKCLRKVCLLNKRKRI